MMDKFKCKICEKEYTREDFYKKHMLDKHGIDLDKIDEEQIILNNESNIIEDLNPEDGESQNEKKLTEEEIEQAKRALTRFKYNGSTANADRTLMIKLYKLATNQDVKYTSCKWKNIHITQVALSYFKNEFKDII